MQPFRRSYFVRMCILCVFQDIIFLHRTQSFKSHYVNKNCLCVCAAVIISIKPNDSISTRLWVSEFIHTYNIRLFVPAHSLCPHHSFNRSHIHLRSINKSIEIKRFRCFFHFFSFQTVCWHSEKRRNLDKPQLWYLFIIFNQHFYCKFFNKNRLFYQFKYLDSGCCWTKIVRNWKSNIHVLWLTCYQARCVCEIVWFQSV